MPQGSILGPLLFLIYINDITLCSNEINIDLFADDSTLHESGFNISDIERQLQVNINAVAKWCKTNNMSLHPKKSKCMILGTTRKTSKVRQLNIKLQDNILEQVNEHKLLGIYIDSNLKWHKQIDIV